MADLLTPLDSTSGVLLLQTVLRLLASLVLGGVVAFIYRRARSESASSFTATLVLLSILIAMVTQVIGDNVARAFSLVGALSIVRFRTVVRDTQDTAYVIFAVAVGMAVGASNLWVALAGIAVVAIAAFAMKRQTPSPSEGPEPEQAPFQLQVRVGLGHDVNTLLKPTLDRYLRVRRVVTIATVKQGAATEISYATALHQDDLAHELVTTLNRLEGVQSVTLQRVRRDDE
jgi:uncharacterized membrane protein YhiD involved in acid resistance